jgi:hypothetical protein
LSAERGKPVLRTCLQILDTMNDEAVARLCQQMFLAVSQDIEENEAGRFAVNKLRMLPLVIEMMQKYVQVCLHSRASADSRFVPAGTRSQSP